MKLKKSVSLLLSMVVILCMLPMTIEAEELPVNGNKIDIVDQNVGPYSLQYLEVYLQDSYEPITIVSAEQNGTEIDIDLSPDTDPSAKLQAGFSGTSGAVLGHQNNKCTLSDGSGTMSYTVSAIVQGRPVAGVGFNINFRLSEPQGPAVKFTTNLSGSECGYVQGKSAMPLTVSAEYVGGESSTPMIYQWYKNTVKSTDGGEAIDGATEESFTPATDEIGTFYYYVVAACEDLTATSTIATVSVEAPSLKIITNLNENEVKYIQGKSANALTFEAEYTGITDNEVVYQWYKSAEKSTDGGEAVCDANNNSFTPATDEIGTTYYYAIASCEGLNVTSSIAIIIVTEMPTLHVADNVIDITDRTIYSYSRYYANATNIKISGANVEKATEDDTTVNIMLDGFTNPCAEISVEFGTSLNRCTMSGHTGSVKLINGEAQLEMTLIGQIASSLKGACTYTINLSLGEAPEVLPERKVETDSIETYNGIGTEIDLKDYFNLAKYYYLINGEEKIPLESNIYTFKSHNGGTHILAFGASNDTGDCPDFVTVSVEVTEIKSGLWLDITTSNGSVNFVKFTDKDGSDIDGLTASLEDKNIVVNVPRGFGINSKITATFDLTQTANLPFVSDSNAFNQGVGTTTGYTTTLSDGAAEKTLYLYNSKPKATSNNYTTYTISYAIQNEAPKLTDNQIAPMTADIIAGESFTLDLAPLFSDADGDELTFTVKINGEDAVSADTNYSFVPALGGTYELEFFAGDFMAASQDSYKVILNVTNSAKKYDMAVFLPDDITPSFYITSGYDENKADVIGDLLVSVKGESTDGYTAYTVSVPENVSVVSVRDEAYGGLSFPASGETAVKLCKVQTEIIDFSGKIIPGAFDVSYGDYNAVGIGGKFLLISDAEYTFTATPENTSVYSAETETLNITEATCKATVKVPYKNPKTVITTTWATAKVFKYSNNYFVHDVYEPLATVDNANGTSTHYFAVDGDLSYRVSMEGKITKAGYIKTGNSVTVLYTVDDNIPTERADYFTETSDAAAVGDDSVLVNINQQNHLSLDLGETKTIKAYRTWQIIDFTYNNHIIEPDFHFNILSGEDVVSLEAIPDQPATNGSGNWQKLTAIGKGTAIVEVTYDAVEISGSSFDGLYGAGDPERCGLFVVTVGEKVPDVDFGIESKSSAGSMVYNEANKKAWDSEFDTLYFIGDSGEIKLSPLFAEGIITEVAISANKGESYSALEAADGVYTASVESGNNILRVTTDAGIAYKIVRGKKVELKVKNNTHPGNPIAAGDEVSLTLVGVHTPIAKIAGTYNPGYKNNSDGDCGVHLCYSFGEEIIRNEGKQYNFSKEGTTIEFTVPENSEQTEFVLTDGYIGLGVIGVSSFPDDGESHRNIPDAGGKTRGSDTSFHTRSMLPDITVNIGMLPSGNTAPYIRENAPKTATLNLGGTYAVSMSKVFTDRDNDELVYTAKIGDGQAVSFDDGYYTFTPDDVGVYAIEFTANDGSVDSYIHIVTLTVKEKQSTSTTPTIEFDIDENEIDGYVKISFEDKGKRVEGEKNLTYPKAIGTIVPSVKVPYKDGDTVADVTLRLLEAYGFTYEHSGTAKENFYLASIGDFTLKGIDYDSFGEFDAGEGSGWMITLNNEFIKYGASEFEVESGDVIKWQYTCQLGADIGDSFRESDDYTSAIRPSNPKNEDDEEDEEDEEDNESEEQNNKEEPKAENTEKLVFDESTFDDVCINDWFYESVKYVYEKGLMKGTVVGFEPESQMTRAMLVTVLYRLENAPTIYGKNTFTDVPNNEWYTNAVIWSKENGIVTGVTENEFAPCDNVTREQMATIIFRYAKFKEKDVSDFASLSAFSDVDDISGFAFSPMSWAYKSGIVKGTTLTTLSPKGNATRAQVATILMRFCKTTAS